MQPSLAAITQPSNHYGRDYARTGGIFHRRREQLAKTVATRVRQLMEPQGHPGLSDDAGIARAARYADLSAEAAASNERQVSALGKIRGVGDLPTYTADAAENYGEQGVHEVADPESSSGQA